MSQLVKMGNRKSQQGGTGLDIMRGKRSFQFNFIWQKEGHFEDGKIVSKASKSSHYMTNRTQGILGLVYFPSLEVYRDHIIL